MSTKKKHRNIELAVVLINDPARFRERRVNGERGKGRKNRPRKRDWSVDSYDCVSLISA